MSAVVGLHGLRAETVAQKNDEQEVAEGTAFSRGSKIRMRIKIEGRELIDVRCPLSIVICIPLPSRFRFAAIRTFVSVLPVFAECFGLFEQPRPFGYQLSAVSRSGGKFF
jgi:hypothetical protein